MRVISCLCLGVILGIVLPLPAQEWQTTRVTNDSNTDYNLDVDAPYMAWERSIGSDTQIFLFNGATSRQVTPSNNRPDGYPSVSADRIVWSGQDASWLQRVYQYDIATQTTSILSDSGWNAAGGVNFGTNAAWTQQVSAGDGSWGVFFKQGALPRIQLPSASEPSYLKVTDSIVAWQEYISGASPRQFQIRVYDIASGQSYPVPTAQPSGLAASGRGVVWSASDGADDEIFYYEAGGTNLQLTNNATSDQTPDISGRNVVWQSFGGPDNEIMLRNLDSPGNVYLTNDTLNDEAPKISGTSVVWQHEDPSGWDREILHYDLSTGVRTQLTNNTYWDGPPSVSGWTVAWSADVNGNSDVFYSVRTGSAPQAPLTPGSIGPDGSFHFTINVSTGGLGHAAPLYLDPVAAIGYDYETAGLNFASVLLPAVGDNLYTLWLWDPAQSAYVFDHQLTAGTTHYFSTGGVVRFRILGIEDSAGLDPLNPLAFPTGVTFVSGGSANVTMIAMVPEPSCLVLLAGGLVAGLTVMLRCMRFHLGPLPNLSLSDATGPKP